MVLACSSFKIDVGKFKVARNKLPKPPLPPKLFGASSPPCPPPAPVKVISTVSAQSGRTNSLNVDAPAPFLIEYIQFCLLVKSLKVSW